MTERSFTLTIAGLALICAVSFGSSAVSLYDYARDQGHGVFVSLSFPAIADLIVLVAHGGAVWLIRNGFSSWRATGLIWAGSLLSILGNFVHAPIDSGHGFQLGGLTVYASQLIGSLPPLGLVATSSFVIFLFERKMELERHDTPSKPPNLTTDKATGKELLHAPTHRATKKKTAKKTNVQKRRDKVARIEDEFPDLTQAEKASKVGCSLRQFQRDLQYLSR